MKVFVILVINVTIKLLGKVFSRCMLNQFMKAFDILVIYVITQKKNMRTHKKFKHKC